MQSLGWVLVFVWGREAVAFLVGWFCCFALGLKTGAGNRREPSYRQLFRKVLSRREGEGLRTAAAGG